MEGKGFSVDPVVVRFRHPNKASDLSMKELLRRLESPEDEVEDGKPIESQKQKSFLQKNWMFMLAGSLIVSFSIFVLRDRFALDFTNFGKFG